MTTRLGTVAAVGFDDFPPTEWLACFRQLGCQVVQAYRNQGVSVSTQQIKDAIAAGGMACDSLHGVYGEQFDPSAPSEPARRSAVDTFKAEGDLALELAGPLVVVHCATIRHARVSLEEQKARVNQLRKSIAELGEFGRSAGVRYAFENLPGYHAIGWDVGKLAEILEELGQPNTGMCFDTGHANMVGDAVAAARRANGQMIYVHLSDNSGRTDDHDMPTYGTLDTEALARALHDAGYHGTLMLEVFCNVDRLKQIIEEGGAERLARIARLANGRPAE